MGRASRAKKERKAELEAELEIRDALLADRDAKIAELNDEVAKLRKLVHGFLQGRRRVPAEADGQRMLFGNAPEQAESKADVSDEEDDDDADDDDRPPAQRGKKKKPRKKLDLSCLPTEERVHELPESERICPETGLLLVPVGQKVVEELHYEPAKTVRILHIYITYGPSPEVASERTVKTRSGELQPRPIEDSIASAAFLAWLLVQKYGYHLPLYRLVSIFARDGLRLSRQTLCDWVLRSAELLAPIADFLFAKVRAGPVMNLDDTPIQCQGGRGAAVFQAYLWTIANPEVSGIAYRFTAGRSSELFVDFFDALDGYAVGDGYSGNKSAAKKALAKDSEGKKRVRMTGCWAHVTRKFREAESEAQSCARLFRKDIKALYAIEAEAAAKELTPEEHVRLRRRRAPRILMRMFKRERTLRDRFSDAGKMAAALRYLRNQRRELSRFLIDARISIDNNACERSIRPIAIGRRNWLFTGSERGGRAAAVIYTLIESCKIANVDPVAYLTDVLVRVSTHPAQRIDELLPANWSELRRRAA